ncbi:PAC2 family protein [Naasia lichenicola]|uniref:PAC2 family protein n=1 Tax=Naasia lichenicola TaxID=2565933 RepID=UPI00130EAEB8|nr:PAC2 family protein [Naasia lichenicola]
MAEKRFGEGRILVVAFEGWNDAGEAASGAVAMLRDALDLEAIHDVDPEQYFDYQFTRPMVYSDDDGVRRLKWPQATMYGPQATRDLAGMPFGIELHRVPETDEIVAELVRAVELDEDVDMIDPELIEDLDAVDEVDETSETESDDETDDESDDARLERMSAENIYVLLGSEPSRSWKSFTAEIIDKALAADISGIVVLGAMLADVPHTRPISVFSSSESADLRAELSLERSTYEGPVGILSVLADVAEVVGIPTVSIWASVPHYVHNAPSPKATLALIERLEEVLGTPIPRGDLEDEATAWEAGIDALAGEDEDMAAYIEQLEQARDTVDSPEASGEAIAKEFERYLRRRGDGRDGFADGRDGSVG